MNYSDEPKACRSEDTMKTYKCMECDREMERNTFVCDICERDKRTNRVNKRKNNKVVQHQFTDSIDVSTDYCQGDSSPYWQHAFSTQPQTDDGETIELAQANPDFVNKDRLDEMERMTKSNIDWFKAVEMLKEAAEILDYEECQAVQDFANGKTQQHTAKKLEMSQKTVSNKLRSGLKKLQKFYEDNYVA